MEEFQVGESDFTSYQSYGNFNIDDYNDTISIISHDACVNRTCIQLCCPFGDRLTSEGTCVAGPIEQDNYTFPDVYQNNSETKKLNELFPLAVHDPCVPQASAHHILNLDEYSFLVNGYLHQDPGEYPGEFVPSTSYCLAALERNIYDAAVCMMPMGFRIYMAVSLLVSLPFLLLTFVVYSLLPDVQNVHSCTLRAHVGSLFVMNLLIYFVQAFPVLSEWKYCIPLAYIFNFALMSACFWLNATCFDIWWTFTKLSLRPVHKKKKKKRFILYSLYAWGTTFLVSAASAIMDHAPGIPKNWTRPKMCTRKFWFGGDHAMTVYFYGPTGTAYVINVFLFVVTALTILYHNKHTASQLRDSESRCYDNHKRKFTMYLKLFIVMGLSWSMGIILWLINASNAISEMVWNISFTIDILQGVFIFILYVCKRKTLRLLLKRFGWQNSSPFLNNILSSSNLQSRTSSNMSHLSSLSGSVNMQNTNLSINLKPDHHTTFNKAK
ncbi:PREDICTED: G-protein coupled receptor Mth2-like [Wasmannia auropunctata]|uniref:G-protein coupled receptor Mth2-like n=1 Tax=Wasmannia auropunctata TaxID=64793 RepID=UPI0005F01859|nr:PREDICTED: G-protein coupled receptor Mth2-like [Wasmannia auropunctata]